MRFLLIILFSIVIILLLRFFGLIMFLLIRFWYIFVPLIAIYYLSRSGKKKSKRIYKTGEEIIDAEYEEVNDNE